MSAGKARLTAAAMVFVGWLTFLGWLALTAGKLPWADEKYQYKVVSRPQFLVANLYVVADLPDDKDKPRVSLPSVVALPQPGWLTSIPWTGLLQTVPPNPQGLPPQLELPTIKVKEVLWSRGNLDLKGAVLVVPNLPLCGEAYGWEGPGTYVLALTKSLVQGNPVYRVTPIPRSPGYEPPPPNDRQLTPAPIYRLTPEVRKQVEHIIQIYHRQER